MFNTTFFISLFFLIIYIFNLLIFTIFVSKNTTSVLQRKLNSNNFWTNTDKIVLTCLVVILAGLPPVSFFFFKIFIILNTKNPYTILFVMASVNVFVLYYYLNFLMNFLNETPARNQLNSMQSALPFESKYILIKNNQTLTLLCFFFNFYFIFFWEFFLCFFSVI